MKGAENIGWKLCVIAFLSLSTLAFSPLVIEPKKLTPTLFGLPYTLWSGILVAVALLFVTFVATRLPYQQNFDTEPNDQ